MLTLYIIVLITLADLIGQRLFSLLFLPHVVAATEAHCWDISLRNSLPKTAVSWHLAPEASFGLVLGAELMLWQMQANGIMVGCIKAWPFLCNVKLLLKKTLLQESPWI